MAPYLPGIARNCDWRVQSAEGETTGLLFICSVAAGI